MTFVRGHAVLIGIIFDILSYYVGKIQDGRPMSNNELKYFWAKQQQVRNFGVYDIVFRHARSNGHGSKITLDISLQVKFKMANICSRPNNINWYHFRYSRSRFIIFVSPIGFPGMHDPVVWSKFTYCVLDKIRDGRHLSLHGLFMYFR